ncbi:MAG: Ca2+-binding RTX toxin-like protein, partial [Pirellulaceae bacterium]
NAAALNVAAVAVSLSAANGIGSGDALEISVTTLAAINSAAGNIEVSNSSAGLLTVGTVGSDTGVINADGDVSLVLNGSLLVEGDVISTGTTTLDLSSAAGTSIDINGDLGGTNSIIVGSSGSDVITIDSNGSTATGTVDNILADVTINAGGGADTLILEDSSDATNDAVVVSDIAISGLVDNGSAINYSSIETLVLNAGDGADAIDASSAHIGSLTAITMNGGGGDDTIDVTTNTTTMLTINGGSPVVPASPGDTLSITTVAIDLPIVFPATTNGSFTSFDAGVPNQPITWTSIETFFFDGQQVAVGELYVRATMGNDRIIYSLVGADEISLRLNDVIYGPFEQVTKLVTFGEEGNDRISASGNVPVPVEFHGGPGRDNLAGAQQNDTFYGDDENDIILTGEGDNTAFGGAGNDTLSGRSGNDILWGGEGNDLLMGAAGGDMLHGDLGNDRLVGGNGSDLLRGGPGNDILSGQIGNDALIGGAGNDELLAGSGDDILIGGEGMDALKGERGSDLLLGAASDHDDDIALLSDMMTIWGFTSNPLSARINLLQSISLTAPLVAATITDDGDIDNLLGGGGADWMLAFGTDELINSATNDVITNL